MSGIFNIWLEWMGVDVTAAFKAAGVPTPVLVVPNAAPDYDNAFWASWFFACGEGNETFYPLCTGGDVLAHELAHGVTQIINYGLLYFGQAGAWNEAFSDMVGMTYNFFSTGAVTPLIGAEVMRGDREALRDMSDPARFSQSSAASNLTSADPHVLSGVPNHAFWLLATSPCYDPKVAMQVAQRAAHLYFTPTTSFEDGANGWARAAKDLGYDAAPVQEAWDSVGLWQVCGNRVATAASGSFVNPDAGLLADSDFKVFYNGTANATVNVGNLTYEHDLNPDGLRPCGLSISLVSFDRSAWLPLENSRPSIYVGIDRMPDPFTGAWDCKMDMEVSVSGPTQPACDVSPAPNTTYYVVAHSMHDWSLQGFNWEAWGPKAVMGPEPAPTCFNGGTCTSDAGCSSGYCSLGYCAKKPRQGAAKRAHTR